MYDTIIFNTTNNLNGDCPDFEWEVSDYEEETVQELIDVVNGSLDVDNWSRESHALYKEILIAMNKTLCADAPYVDLDDAICMCDNIVEDMDCYEDNPEICNAMKEYIKIKEKYDNGTNDGEDSLENACSKLLLAYIREELIYDFDGAEGN